MLNEGGFSWSLMTVESFNHLKQAMVTAPIISMPDFSKQFVFEADVPLLGLGAVLLQEGKPIAYFSRALHDRNKNSSVYDRELLALVLSVKR